MSLTIFNAFVVGLFSTLHCLGMCGGIIGTLTMSLPEAVRNNTLRLLSYTSIFNTGRLLSYTLAGAIAGAFGQTVMEAISPRYAHIILQVLATLIMVGIGIHLAGWFPRFNLIEKIGIPLWRKLEPVTHRLLPIQKPSHAFLFGLVWGWLPCGLVYAALIWSTSAGDALQGGLFMLAFGTGTLVPVMAAGMLTGWMVKLGQMPNIRPVIGSIIIVLALLSLVITLQQGVTPHAHNHGGH